MTNLSMSTRGWRTFAATETTVSHAAAGLPAPADGEPDSVPAFGGGPLGGRAVIRTADGTYRLGRDSLSLGVEAGMTTREFMSSRCMPVLFFQEVLHRDRAGKSDDLVYEQPRAAQGGGHPGVRLDPETLCLKHSGQPLTHHAQTQLCRLGNVPIEYYHRLVAQGVKQLAAVNANTGIRLRAAHVRGASNGKFLLRARHGVVDGVLTDGYGIFDNHDLLDAFVECFPRESVPDLVVSQFWTDGRDVEGTVIVPDQWTNEPGHVFGLGIAFANSENGRRSMTFRPFVTRNGVAGLVYDRRETANGVLEIKHTSTVSAASVKTQIAAAVPDLLRSANSLRTHLLNSRQIDIPNPRDVLAALALRHGIPAGTSRQWYRTWLEMSGVIVAHGDDRNFLAGAEPNTPTVFGLIDSLMETALTQNAEGRADLQSLAGQMLIDGLDKSEAQLTEYWMSTTIPSGQRLRRRAGGPESILDFTVGAPAATPVRR